MRFRILCIIILLICFVCGCSLRIETLPNKKSPKDCLIIINNQSIHSEHAKVYRSYAILPMFEVLAAYGVSVNWLSENDAHILFGDVFLELSLTAMELIDNRNGNDYFLPLPGCSHYVCESIGNEIVLDDNTLHNILFQLGIKTEVIIDYSKGEVSLNQLS